MSFASKLRTAIATNQSILCLGLDPNPEVMPAKYKVKYDAEINSDVYHDRAVAYLWEWMNFIIQSTADLVCAYKPTLGFYTALGAGGLELLAKTLAAIPPEIPIILDAKHADLNSSTVMARTAFEQWGVDAITLSPYIGQDLAARFLMYPEKAIFVSCYSSNATAQGFQEYPNREQPLYLNVVQNCQAWAGTENLALEVGAANPAALAKVRSLAPERLILARSIWANSLASGQKIENLGAILEAGLDATSGGLILPVNQDALALGEPAQLVRSLRDEVNQAIATTAKDRPSCDLWMPNVCLLDQQGHPHANLILQLFDIGCITFEETVQASGQVFPYYIDLRRIISNPQVFDAVINTYAEILQNLKFDRIAGIPYGSLPTASGLALRLNFPLIFPRKEVKAYGARRLIEGNYETGETIVVVDDILISGKSAIEGAQKIESCGLKVRDIVVFIDHEAGVRDRIAKSGYSPHAVLKISEINETLYQSGRINEKQFLALSHSSSDID
ncbi:bifunctional orotidine-5'-phosphate decarboxylase/orotate phosphoribosyltransferase [Pseudanabaena sp. FACHB-1998]|uniref:bifunctional orotidine-5'-phosphate decarboxylase/orotate phosphoribosyltransferase n=1 Tax=Pseudanabaena sp. FACHB-1998 TaxID=2692858 RepID=UPI00168084EE|nr:bifunctional orotidine-5'-phosphate decarboxylase/orotate phosphoribosyltransferase [Pseudanabaena sp. FACHB-1998]MBD2177940.1 bifunctional orotidine-5'-phosphate decarboxylase/orotate phosphoribosyltransferase [Pseudanabaena sp. FACHB-1998]